MAPNSSGGFPSCASHPTIIPPQDSWAGGNVMEKVCVNHPESPSVGSCKACEKPVCLMCIVEVGGVSFCSDACGSAYQEVKDWLERPAADEEWNPLADSKATQQ